MRDLIDIVEAARPDDRASILEARVAVWSGATITVLHNPSRAAFENFAKRCEVLRGLLSDDGNQLTEPEFLYDVRMNGRMSRPEIDCIFYVRGVWKGPNLREPTGLYKPAIQRITPAQPQTTQDDDELLSKLFDESMMRDLIRIVESVAPTGEKSRADQFLDEVWRQTTPHPFSRGERIFNNASIITVRPDVDDRETAVHISDIVSIYPGQGGGRDALKFIIGLADQFGVKLTLFAKAYMVGPRAKTLPKTKDLVAWYGRYGFVKKRGGEMVRLPQG
jgi:hypothetical protein